MHRFLLTPRHSQHRSSADHNTHKDDSQPLHSRDASSLADALQEAQHRISESEQVHLNAAAHRIILGHKIEYLEKTLEEVSKLKAVRGSQFADLSHHTAVSRRAVDERSSQNAVASERCAKTTAELQSTVDDLKSQLADAAHFVKTITELRISFFGS